MIMQTSNFLIGVIDGQGGGIGSHIVKNTREKLGNEVEIVVLGTNAVATASMMKAKANRGASGENAIVQTVPSLNIILGPLAITMPNSMLGEITPVMARAICSSPASKILLPLKTSNLELVGITGAPLPHLIADLLDKVKQVISSGGKV